MCGRKVGRTCKGSLVFRCVGLRARPRSGDAARRVIRDDAVPTDEDCRWGVLRALTPSVMSFVWTVSDEFPRVVSARDAALEL